MNAAISDSPGDRRPPEPATAVGPWAGHEKDLGGGFRVRRLLPTARQRAVGPFLFFDHFGPVEVQPADQHDVRPHPHIGLATVTYLFEGALMHRDSVGSVQRIEPGAINWMTAGRGIVHSERRPDDLAGRPYRNHGLQLWLALPVADEECEPSFSHTPAEAIPTLRIGGAEVRVLAGEYGGVASPVPTRGRPFYAHLRLPAGIPVHCPAVSDQDQTELALYPVQSALQVDARPVAAQHMALLDARQPFTLTSETAQDVMLVGGQRLEAPRHMWWNFVSSRRERIHQASQDWEQARFPGVPGETERIELPPHRFAG